jgi:hypothetical protein
VAPVKGGQLAHAHPFRGGHDRGLDRAEGKVPVGAGELGDPDPVRGQNRFGQQVSRREIAEKANLGLDPEPGAEQVDDLGDDQDGNDQRSRMTLEDLEAFLVMPVVAIDVGIKGPGIDDERYEATSARRICSICSETSAWPLRPAPAARRLRRP